MEERHAGILECRILNCITVYRLVECVTLLLREDHSGKTELINDFLNTFITEECICEFWCLTFGNDKRSIDTITVLKYNDQVLEPKKEGVYTFTMPAADVLISATIDLDAISLRDDYANLEVLSGNTGKITNVTLHGRTLWKDGSWNTICLPFALSDQDIATGDCPLHGARIKTLSGATFLDGVLTLSFSDASSIEAGKPYIVMWDPGTDISDPVFLGVTIVDTEPESVVADNVTFTGIFSPVSLTANDKTKLYLGADNKLYYAQKDLDINSFRGYFVLGDGIRLNSVQRIVLDIDDIRIK